MLNKLRYYFFHDRFFRFLIFFSILLFIGISALMIWVPSDRILKKRGEDMKRCVELKIFPTTGDTEYQVRFEDEFFCPTQPYTVLEALERAESVLNTRNKPIALVINKTPDGTNIESMLGKTNNPNGTWELEVNSNERIYKPLDRVVLQGASFINFYYRQD